MANLTINREYQLEGCCSKDDTRLDLCSCRVQGQRMYATDGHVLASVPVVAEQADGPVPVEALKAARKAFKRGPASLALTKTRVEIPGGASFPRDDVGPFPKVEKVIKDSAFPYAKDYVTVAVDVGLLVNACKAIGSEKVFLVIHPDTSRTFQPADKPDHPHAGSPLTVYPFNTFGPEPKDQSGPFALVMPLRVDK
jgi:hypothetical protein